MPEKNWKFSATDAKERSFWDDYMKAYGEAIEATSTKEAPWYIVPADKKWFTRVAVSEIILKKIGIDEFAISAGYRRTPAQPFGSERVVGKRKLIK